ncbi:hypothetical protein CPC08DRAFT_796319 [Agrocybe pediades]|nr:hypothetical protein CPC08DRAFT_796319 [Agrocybe pediades]
MFSSDACVMAAAHAGYNPALTDFGISSSQSASVTPTCASTMNIFDFISLEETYNLPFLDNLSPTWEESGVYSDVPPSLCDLSQPLPQRSSFASAGYADVFTEAQHLVGLVLYPPLGNAAPHLFPDITPEQSLKYCNEADKTPTASTWEGIYYPKRPVEDEHVGDLGVEMSTLAKKSRRRKDDSEPENTPAWKHVRGSAVCLSSTYRAWNVPAVRMRPYYTPTSMRNKYDNQDKKKKRSRRLVTKT